MSLYMNPSASADLWTVHNGAITAATLDLTTGLDLSAYEYVLILMSLGAGDTAVTFTLQDSDTSTSGFADVLTLHAFTATDDLKAKAVEVRWRSSRKKFLNIKAVGTGGTGMACTVAVIGMNPEYSTLLGTRTGSVPIGTLSAVAPQLT